MKSKTSVAAYRALQFTAGFLVPFSLFAGPESSFAQTEKAQLPASAPPRVISPSVAPKVAPSPTTPSPAPTPAATKPPEADEQVPNLPNMQVFEGSGSFVNPPNNKARIGQSGDVTLDFSDVDIRDVIRTIFGEILQKSYTIDPKVTGRITLKTGRPISKDAMMSVLETALRLNGAAIAVTDDIFNVVPIADAQHNAQMLFGGDDAHAAGYGVEVVPLDYVSADEMQRILTPLVPEGAIIQIDSKRNLVFLAGTEPERAAIRATITRFDVNYLKGMSFALIQPTHSDVESLAAELEKIFGEASSPISGMVRIVPISRINSLLVVTARPKYLREVQRWVGRLDVAPVTPNRKLYFYRLQNARARDVAEILGRLFGTSSGAQEIGAVGTSSRSSGASTFPRDGGSPPSLSQRTQTSATTQSSTAASPLTTPSMPPAAPSIARGATPSAYGPQIVTDESNNALIIRADAADYAAIEEVIAKMDIAPNQVLVEATIVEVTLNDTLKYGVEWYFKKGDNTFTMSPSGNVASHFPGLGVTYTVGNINVALSTLGALTDVSVLSSPKILTLDNKPATIEVGDQIPIVTQTAISTNSQSAPIVSSVEQRDTGVILSVTPRIGNSGIVFLDVSQEVSTSTQTTTSNIDSPTIQQRRIQSTVAVNDGATIALGGLIQRSDTISNSGIPYLKDIPGLGGLFSARSSVRGRTELLVFLTPHVIRNLPAALDITDRLKKQMEAVRDAMSELEGQRVPRRPW
jgi:general secretion pathway protein D